MISRLNVFSNGELVYQIKGIWAKVSVTWNFEAPPGGGDTHYSMMYGSKCDLVIRQGVEEQFLPTLYVENVRGVTMQNFTSALEEALTSLPYYNLEIELVREGM